MMTEQLDHESFAVILMLRQGSILASVSRLNGGHRNG